MNETLNTTALNATACVEASGEVDLTTVEWWRWLLIVGLIALSGCFSGLNLGVLGLEVSDLEIIAEEPFADP